MVLGVLLLRVVAGVLVERYVLAPKIESLSERLGANIHYDTVSFGFLSPSMAFKALRIPQPASWGSGWLLETEHAEVEVSWWDLPDERTMKLDEITLTGALFRGTLDGQGHAPLALLLPALLLGGSYDGEGHYVPRGRYRIDHIDIEGALRLDPPEGTEGVFALENLSIEGEDLHNLPDGPEGSLLMKATLGGARLGLSLEEWEGFDDVLHAATGRLRLDAESLPLNQLNPLLRHMGVGTDVLQGSLDLKWDLACEEGRIVRAEAPVTLKGVKLDILDPQSPLAAIDPWLRVTGGAFSAPLPISGTLEKPAIGFKTFDMKSLLHR